MSDIDSIPNTPPLPWDYDVRKAHWTHGENGLVAICHPDAENRFRWQGYTRYFEQRGDVPIDIFMSEWRDESPEAVVERMERIFHPEIFK